MKTEPSTKKNVPSMEDSNLLEILAKMGISLEEFEKMRKESEEDPETIAITERSLRFEHGTETEEDIAWLEDSKKQSPSYLGMIIDHQSPLHPIYKNLKERGFIDSDSD